MRKKLLGLAVAAAFLAPAAVSASTLGYGGALAFQLATLPGLVAPGSGLAVVNGSEGGAHLSTLQLVAGGMGPVGTSLPVTSNTAINSIVFTSLAAGTGTPIASGAGAPMGVSGTAKICLVFAPCAYSSISIPLTPVGATGFGVGGTQVFTGGVNVTLQHAAWSIGTPTMTIHSANSNVSTPTLPGGFAHGPGTLTSTTAQNSGVVQLVSVAKVYTSLTSAFPELPVIGILQLHLVPEPGTLMLVGAGVLGLAAFGRSRKRK